MPVQFTTKAQDRQRKLERLAKLIQEREAELDALRQEYQTIRDSLPYSHR